jgi:CBS domain-containing protein
VWHTRGPLDEQPASLSATTLTEPARFLARLEPFEGLGRQALERLAAVAVERVVPAGEAVLVGGGTPGTALYVVRDGALELLLKEIVVDIVVRGEVFGHPTLLTGEAPMLTVRARERSTLLCIPGHIALSLLSRPQGVRFVARTLRDRLLLAARTMRALPDVHARPVTSLLRDAARFCEPGATIADAAALMAAEGLSALLVRTREGLGIVTDVDLRDKVVATRSPTDAPVSTIMTTPVRTVRTDALAQEASVAMMSAGVNHLPVVDAAGTVVGMLSSSSLMTLDALSPFALRHTILAAHSVDEVAEASRDVPKLFVDLLDAHLDAPALTRILTLLNDAMTSRLLELFAARHGRPPVPFAWLAMGSAARSELTLASDQDNGLAYADSEDPAVDEYFALMAREINEGLGRCGFSLDTHGVLASNSDWRMPA